MMDCSSSDLSREPLDTALEVGRLDGQDTAWLEPVEPPHEQREGDGALEVLEDVVQPHLGEHPFRSVEGHDVGREVGTARARCDAEPGRIVDVEVTA